MISASDRAPHSAMARSSSYPFRSKDALLAGVLDDQHALVLARIQGWAARAEAD